MFTFQIPLWQWQQWWAGELHLGQEILTEASVAIDTESGIELLTET